MHRFQHLLVLVEVLIRSFEICSDMGLDLLRSGTIKKRVEEVQRTVAMPLR